MTEKSFQSARRGLMLILSSPSGAGKTTLSRKLLASDDDIAMSVSATTRKPRPGEVEGKDYFFVTQDRFAEMVTASEFLEHATVFSNSYGTPRGPVEDALSAGKDVLFDIDWQGTQQISQEMPNDLVRIFILPPSMQALEERLKKRAQDTDEVVQARMAKAADEITHWAEYDYVLVNDNLEQTYTDLVTILAAERQRRDRQKGLNGFVKSLIG